MNFKQSRLALLTNKHLEIAKRDLTPLIWIAYSGGLDSTVLLHVLANDPSIPANKLKAIHINHGLSPHADQWVTHCQQVCEQLNIPLVVKNVQGKPKSGESIEAWARDQRYQIFEKHPGQNDVLCMAHHADDQAETVLLRLMRGAGTPGLAGMPAERALGKGKLIRPFLTHSKADLRQYAEKQDLTWIEDESNTHIQFDRNFVRHEVLPLLQQRWPKAVEKLNQTAQHCQQDNQVITQWANKILSSSDLTEGSVTLDLTLLQQYSQAEQALLIRHWLKTLGQLYPTQPWLQELHNSVINAKPDAKPMLKLGAGEIRRYRTKLYWIPASAGMTKKVAPYCIPWEEGITIPDYPNPITKALLIERGLNPDKTDWNQLMVCNRGGYPHPSKLKKVFQASGTPPWQRDQTVIIYDNQEQKILILLY